MIEASHIHWEKSSRGDWAGKGEHTADRDILRCVKPCGAQKATDVGADGLLCEGAVLSDLDAVLGEVLLGEGADEVDRASLRVLDREAFSFLDGGQELSGDEPACLVEGDVKDHAES